MGNVKDKDEGPSVSGRRILSASPLIWVLLVGALLWGAWATVTRASSSSSKPGMRALLVPTAGRDRMLVSLPCSAIGGGGTSKARSGATSVTLPADSGLRVVLIPGCESSSSGASGASGGGSGSSSSQSSAADPVLVLAPGTPPPRVGSSPLQQAGKVTQVTALPASARLIVSLPCITKSGNGSSSSSSSTPPPVPSGRGVVTTPACSAASG